jgi:hypothetical protein
MIELLANIDVDNLERAIDFYSRAFGLKVGRRPEAFGAVEMLGASSKIYLLAKAAGTASSAGSPAPRNYQRHWTAGSAKRRRQRVQPRRSRDRRSRREGARHALDRPS